jgi:MFS family permease
MAAASFYFTTEMSLLPRILKDKQLQYANELHSIIWSFSYTVGMALSGYFVYLFGIKSAFLVDSFMFLVAFFIIYDLKIEINIEEKSKKLFGLIKETFIYLKNDIKVFHLMLLHAFVGFSAFDALVALLADSYYKELIAVSLSIGLLHSFRAIGLVIGPLILSKWIDNKRLSKIFLAQAVAIMIWAMFMQNFYLSLFLSILVGFWTTTLWSYTYTLIQKNMDKRFYGRIVAYNDMLFLGISSITSYMIGYLAKNGFSLESIAFFMGLTFIIGGLYYTYIYKNYKLNRV